MDILYKMTEFLANLFDGATAVIFLTVMVGRREDGKRNEPFIAACCLFAVLNAVLQNVGHDFFLPLFCLMFCNLLFECLFLKGSMGTKIIYNVLYQIILMLTNMLTVFSLSIITSSSVSLLTTAGEEYRIIGLLANKLIIILVVGLFVLFGKRKQLDYKEWLSAFLISFGVFLSGLALIDIGFSVKMENDVKRELILMTAGLLIISISSGVCIYRLNRMYYCRMENQVLKSKVREEQAILGKVQEMYEENRILRHDLKRYFTLALGMLETEPKENVRRYIEDMIHTKFESRQWYHTKSSAVNAVLNDAAMTCEREKISLEIKVTGTIREEKQIAIGVILSNLLENAIEAEQRIEEQPCIEAELFDYKDMFVIKVSNKIAKSVLEGNPSLYSNKKESKHHGLGVKSIRKMLAEMDGYLEYSEENERLIARVMIPNSTKLA